MKENRRVCSIFGAGEYEGLTLQATELQEQYVIAADGGYLFLCQNQIVPDLFVGDFDSGEQMEDFLRNQTLPPEIEMIRLNPIKDDTDMLYAIKEGMKRGCQEFHLYGGLGGRLDHTISNIQALAYLSSHKKTGYLIGNNMFATILENETILFDESVQKDKYISVFAYGGNVSKVSLKGFAYELKDAKITGDFPIGTSNRFIGKQAMITISKGKLLVVAYTKIDKILKRKRIDE